MRQAVTDMSHASTAATTLDAATGVTFDGLTFYVKLVAVLSFALFGWTLAAALAAGVVKYAVSLWSKQPGSFDRVQYGMLFFVMTSLAVCALRCLDLLLHISGLVPKDAPAELQGVWETMLAQWPWALRHAGFAGTVGMASFVVTR